MPPIAAFDPAGGPTAEELAHVWRGRVAERIYVPPTGDRQARALLAGPHRRADRRDRRIDRRITSRAA